MREDTWSSGRNRAERRYREFRTERADRRYWEFRTERADRRYREFRTKECREKIQGV